VSFFFSDGGFEPTMGANPSGSDGGATEKQSGGLFRHCSKGAQRPRENPPSPTKKEKTSSKDGVFFLFPMVDSNQQWERIRAAATEERQRNSPGDCFDIVPRARSDREKIHHLPLKKPPQRMQGLFPISLRFLLFPDQRFQPFAADFHFISAP